MGVERRTRSIVVPRRAYVPAVACGEGLDVPGRAPRPGGFGPAADFGERRPLGRRVRCTGCTPRGCERPSASQTRHHGSWSDIGPQGPSLGVLCGFRATWRRRGLGRRGKAAPVERLREMSPAAPGAKSSLSRDARPVVLSLQRDDESSSIAGRCGGARSAFEAVADREHGPRARQDGPWASFGSRLTVGSFCCVRGAWRALGAPGRGSVESGGAAGAARTSVASRGDRRQRREVTR